MIDIAEQLCVKWARLNPDEPTDVTADMTRLTLDTIALCGFSYRFNSFYRDTQHPFVGCGIGPGPTLVATTTGCTPHPAQDGATQ